ncbi:hypothetical protein OT109_12730 [Phycisphaeraceae bacterium D3-23]
MDRKWQVTSGGVILAVVMGVARTGRYLYMKERSEERQAQRDEAQREKRERFTDRIDRRMEQNRWLTDNVGLNNPAISLPRSNSPSHPHSHTTTQAPSRTGTHTITPLQRPTPSREETQAPTPPGRTVLPVNPGGPTRTPPPTRNPGGPSQPVEAEPDPVGPMVVIYSPLPDASALVPYARWESADDYEAFLGDPVTVGSFALRPTTEFSFEGQSARRASWDVPGSRGIGLDLRVDTVHPRDAGLASPVIEDSEDRQEFRLGRQTQRARGGAEVSYRDVNGLLIWRISVPAVEGAALATCYYTAIVDDQMVVLTARYDKDRLDQLEGFDAMAESLTFSR